MNGTACKTDMLSPVMIKHVKMAFHRLKLHGSPMPLAHHVTLKDAGTDGRTEKAPLAMGALPCPLIGL